MFEFQKENNKQVVFLKQDICERFGPLWEKRVINVRYYYIRFKLFQFVPFPS